MMLVIMLVGLGTAIAAFGLLAAVCPNAALAVTPVSSVQVPILMYHAVDATPLPGPYGPCSHEVEVSGGRGGGCL